MKKRFIKFGSVFHFCVLKVYVDGLVKKAYENWNLVIEYDGKSLLDLKQPQRLSITHTDLENYSTAAIDHPMQMAGHSSSMPANQPPVLSDFAIGGLPIEINLLIICFKV